MAKKRKGDISKRVIPPMPRRKKGETDDEYTDRLTGADGKGGAYKERRFRGCCLGWHDDCTDPWGEECECPCHDWVINN